MYGSVTPTYTRHQFVTTASAPVPRHRAGRRTGRGWGQAASIAVLYTSTGSLITACLLALVLSIYKRFPVEI